MSLWFFTMAKKSAFSINADGNTSRSESVSLRGVMECENGHEKFTSSSLRLLHVISCQLHCVHRCLLLCWGQKHVRLGRDSEPRVVYVSEIQNQNWMQRLSDVRLIKRATQTGLNADEWIVCFWSFQLKWNFLKMFYLIHLWVFSSLNSRFSWFDLHCGISEFCFWCDQTDLCCLFPSEWH